MDIDYPELLPGVFAAGDINHDNIPDTDAEIGRMAWDVGFPEKTSTPMAIGGVPPRRLDMNGFGNRISQHIFWMQSGALYNWNAGLDYPSGAHILGSDGKEYIAIADNGPTSSLGAVNPVDDVNHTAWKSWSFLLVDVIYPVGSIYMSVGNTKPDDLFGGVWQRIEERFLLASSANYALGSKGGEKSITLTANQMPVHNHTASAANDTHSHSVTMPGQTISTTTGFSVTHAHDVTLPQITVSTTENGSHNHERGTIDITGTFFGMELREDMTNNPYTGAFSLYRTYGRAQQGFDVGTAVWYLTKFQASKGWTGKSSANGAHTHSVTVPATTMTTTDNGKHTHSVSVTVPEQTATSAGNTHTHTITVNNAGGNAAVSIMPPYLTVNVWKRTA